MNVKKPHCLNMSGQRDPPGTGDTKVFGMCNGERDPRGTCVPRDTVAKRVCVKYVCMHNMTVEKEGIASVVVATTLRELHKKREG